jgi:hypothetical protein
MTGPEPRDRDPEIRELAEAGLIENISPAPYREEATEDFGERLEGLLNEDGTLPEGMPGSRNVRGRKRRNLLRIRHQIADRLRARGRNRAADAMLEKRLGSPDATLTLFLTALAEIISRERNLAPMTDDPIFDALAAYLGEGTPGPEPKQVEVGLAAAELLIPTPSCDAVASLPVKDLLEIREKLSGQRRSFRAKIQAQTAAFATLPSEAALRDHLKRFCQEIKDDLDIQREALKASKVKDVWSFFSVTAPASLVVEGVVAASAPIALPLGSIGAVALGVTGWYMNKRRGEETKGHYMLSVEHALRHRKPSAFESALKRLLRR